MLLHTECFNPYHTNCYFLTDEESGSTVIIDPGCYFRRERTRVQHLIRLNDWHIVQILATHLHIDHIFGVHFLTKAYGCPFGASPLDNDWMRPTAVGKSVWKYGCPLFPPPFPWHTAIPSASAASHCLSSAYPGILPAVWYSTVLQPVVCFPAIPCSGVASDVQTFPEATAGY